MSHNTSDLMTVEQAAAYRGVTRYVLDYERTKGIGPAYAKLRHRVFYRKRDIDEWIESHIVTPGGAA